MVYVYLVFEKKDYFFGSITAIYDHLSAEQVGAGYHTLQMGFFAGCFRFLHADK